PLRTALERVVEPDLGPVGRALDEGLAPGDAWSKAGRFTPLEVTVVRAGAKSGQLAQSFPTPSDAFQATPHPHPHPPPRPPSPPPRRVGPPAHPAPPRVPPARGLPVPPEGRLRLLPGAGAAAPRALRRRDRARAPLARLPQREPGGGGHARPVGAAPRRVHAAH